LLRFQRADGSEFIKIADFGLGQRPDNPSGQMTTSVFGTKGYIDPVAQITQNFTAPSDIYSLGVTMRELLTGNKSLRRSIPGPPKFQALITTMTDPNVNNRPSARQTFEQVRTVLQRTPVPPVQKPEASALGLLVAGVAVVVGVCLLANAE
jgi:serine/threonine protein kinase